MVRENPVKDMDGNTNEKWNLYKIYFFEGLERGENVKQNAWELKGDMPDQTADTASALGGVIDGMKAPEKTPDTPAKKPPARKAAAKSGQKKPRTASGRIDLDKGDELIEENIKEDNPGMQDFGRDWCTKMADVIHESYMIEGRLGMADGDEKMIRQPILNMLANDREQIERNNKQIAQALCSKVDINDFKGMLSTSLHLMRDHMRHVSSAKRQLGDAEEPPAKRRNNTGAPKAKARKAKAN